MNIKKLFATIITGVSLFGFAGMAAAAQPTGDINEYGSSAMFTFWSAEASTFLSGEGCTVNGVGTWPAKANTYYIVNATCSGNNVNFRVTAKASFDGILAVTGNSTNTNITTEALPIDSYGTTCDGQTGPTPYHRPMIDVTTCSTWNGSILAGNGTCTKTLCQPVTAGASDVAATSINQSSAGNLLGPRNGGACTRNFTGANGLNGLVDATTGNPLTDCQDVIVPFSFFANSSTPVTAGVTSLTSADVKLIFSGQVHNWQDIGYNNVPINVCLRHAGSGSHATLVLSQLKPAGVITAQHTSGTYNFYFNDGTGDELNCLNDLSNSVGYADSDKFLSNPATIVPLTYNGYSPNDGGSPTGSNLRQAIEKGEYDFWTVENLYYQDPNAGDLCSFISSQGTSGISLPDAYYAYKCSMHFMKANDAAYPAINASFNAACPQ